MVCVREWTARGSSGGDGRRRVVDRGSVAEVQGTVREWRVGRTRLVWWELLGSLKWAVNLRPSGRGPPSGWRGRVTMERIGRRNLRE